MIVFAAVRDGTVRDKAQGSVSMLHCSVGWELWALTRNFVEILHRPETSVEGSLLVKVLHWNNQWKGPMETTRKRKEGKKKTNESFKVIQWIYVRDSKAAGSLWRLWTQSKLFSNTSHIEKQNMINVENRSKVINKNILRQNTWSQDL